MGTFEAVWVLVLTVSDILGLLLILRGGAAMTGPCSRTAPCPYRREGGVCTFCWVLGKGAPTPEAQP